MGRPTVGDEPRKLIGIRLDAKVLGWLRKDGEEKKLPYQSLINEILAGEMRKVFGLYHEAPLTMHGDSCAGLTKPCRVFYRCDTNAGASCHLSFIPSM
jgi:hypothetical protein